MCSTWANVLTLGSCQVVEWTWDGITWAAGAGAGAVGSYLLDGAAQSAGHAAGQLLTASLGWWTFTGTVDFHSPAIDLVQSYTMPLTVIMLTLGVIFAGAKTALARKGEPLVNLAVNLFMFVVVSVAGTGIFFAIQLGGDTYSRWIIRSAGANLGNKFAEAALSEYAAAFGVILISLLCILIAFIQWILMFFRMAAIVILAGMLPLVAGASVMQGRTDSAKSVCTACLALLLYKPTAATIYAAGFATLSEEATLMTMLQGIVILVMAIIALPTLVKLFSWATTSSSSGSGGFAAVAGLAGLMMMRGAGSGGGGAGADGAGTADGSGSTGSPGGVAGQHAQEMEQRGLGSQGASGGDQPESRLPRRPAGGGAGAGSVGPDGGGAAAIGTPPDPGSGPSVVGADSPAGTESGSGAGGGGGPGAGAAAGASSAEGGVPPAAVAAQQAYQSGKGAAENAVDPGAMGPDRPT